ncbi:MAG: NUDIX domain-containing protein [Bacteroidota bacterium]
MRELTHAGGIVFRVQNGIVYYLIITAKDDSSNWVLPKGHIIFGESPADTATREVLEETGIKANLLKSLKKVEFTHLNEFISVEYFLMRYIEEVESSENRNKKWCTFEEAMNLLTFKESKEILRIAVMSTQK